MKNKIEKVKKLYQELAQLDNDYKKIDSPDYNLILYYKYINNNSVNIERYRKPLKLLIKLRIKKIKKQIKELID